MIRQWQLFLDQFPLVLCPVSGEPPFAWGLDTESDQSIARVLKAQETQFAVALLGLPAIAVPTGLTDVGGSLLPTGVQLISDRFREDLLLDAAEAIEKQYPSPTPIDPR